MSIQVVQIQAFIVRVRLKRKVKHASHARTETANLIVRCELSDGSVGWGEGVPREYVTGESADSAFELLEQTNWKELFSHSCGSFAEAVGQAEGLKLPMPPSDDGRGCSNHAARCAVELAYLDAFGRAFGEPLLAVVNQLAPELALPQERVRYSGIILSSKRPKIILASFAQRLFGLKQLKVKVGIAGQIDVARLRLIRRVVGKRMELRVDANEAWLATDAVRRIQELEPFGITSVEQPVAHAEVNRLAEVRSQIQTPIMLDESLCSMIDAERAVAGGWCDAFNLRLSKCGGFIPTLRLAQYAQNHGKTFQLGCQVGETGILSAAGRHFACIVRGLTALEGSYDRRLVHETFTQEDLTFGRGGFAPMLTGCGLGVTVLPQQIAPQILRRAVLYETE